MTGVTPAIYYADPFSSLINRAVLGMGLSGVPNGVTNDLKKNGDRYENFDLFGALHDSDHFFLCHLIYELLILIKGDRLTF